MVPLVCESRWPLCVFYVLWLVKLKEYLLLPVSSNSDISTLLARISYQFSSQRVARNQTVSGGVDCADEAAEGLDAGLSVQDRCMGSGWLSSIFPVGCLPCSLGKRTEKSVSSCDKGCKGSAGSPLNTRLELLESSKLLNNLTSSSKFRNVYFEQVRQIIILVWCCAVFSLLVFCSCCNIIRVENFQQCILP